MRSSLIAAFCYKALSSPARRGESLERRPVAGTAREGNLDSPDGYLGSQVSLVLGEAIVPVWNRAHTPPSRSRFSFDGEGK